MERGHQIWTMDVNAAALTNFHVGTGSKFTRFSRQIRIRFRKWAGMLFWLLCPLPPPYLIHNFWSVSRQRNIARKFGQRIWILRGLLNYSKSLNFKNFSILYIFLEGGGGGTKVFPKSFHTGTRCKLLCSPREIRIRFRKWATVHFWPLCPLPSPVGHT